MLINNNIPALNTLNKLNKNNKNSSLSMQKLSSGLRINKAGDDAAGLAISEKMRAQIRGIEQAQRNIQDGISLIQTAEGGLSDIHANIHRANELVIQAATDTITSQDRREIQKEIDQIKQGIDKIANSTEFNGIKLLNVQDKYKTLTASTPFDYGNVLSLSVDSEGKFTLRTNEGFPGTNVDNNALLAYSIGQTNYPAVQIGGTSYLLRSQTITDNTENGGVFTTNYSIGSTGIEVIQEVKIVEDKYDFRYSIKNNGSADQNIGFYFHIDTKLGGDDQAPFIVNGTNYGVGHIDQEESWTGGSVPTEFTVYNASIPDIKAQGILKGSGILIEPDEFRIGNFSHVGSVGWTDDNTAIGDSGYALKWNERSIAAGQSFTVNTLYGLTVPPTVTLPDDAVRVQVPNLLLQVGANTGDSFGIDLTDARAETLGINDILVDPFEKALEAMGKLKIALETVSSERGKYGAYQNRLEHALNNAENYALNLVSAESRIRDIDMAKEMLAFTKSNILSQASQGMLSQANQKPQAVLELIK